MSAHQRTHPPYQSQPHCPFPIREPAGYPIASTIQAPMYSPPMPLSRFTAPQVVNQIRPNPVLVPPFLKDSSSVGRMPFPNMPTTGYVSENAASSINEQGHPDEAATINQNGTEDTIGHEDVQMDPLEFFLKMPKELFPTPRMLSLDPNPLINEFCKLDHVNDHVPWILDLEFGSRASATRDVPVYDVQFKNIYCQNRPGAIHPGFNSCSTSFKKEFLAYYDCIISAWYKGYMAMNENKGEENFQSWLSVMMQNFGMCWP